MSGGGGKGGSQTQSSSTQIPPWIQQPAQRAIDRGERIAEIGYTPYMGPDVAAMSAPQMDGMRNTASAASAFGFGASDPMAGMPAPQTFAGGVQGYSSFPLYEETLDNFAQKYPGQHSYMQSFFIDPVGNGAAAAPQSAPMGDRESVYRALGYREIPGGIMPLSDPGVFGAEDGTIFVDPGTYQNMYGK